MKNAWLIKNFNKRDFYKRELDAARRKLTRVQRQIDLLEEQCEALDRVTEIFHPGNVALADSFATGRWERDGYHHFTPASEDIGRWSDVHPNVNRSGTFVVNINGWNDDMSGHLWDGGKWLGSDWPSEIEACKAAKVWVAKGKIVEREEAEIL